MLLEDQLELKEFQHFLRTIITRLTIIILKTILVLCIQYHLFYFIGLFPINTLITL